MLIRWYSGSLVYLLAEGSDRSGGKRCGPYDFAAPLSVAGEDTPCIDAEYLQPEARGNRSSRVSFSVSVELATQGAALAFVAACRRLPISGTLVTIDEITGEIIRYDFARVAEIDPRQSGVAVDVRYSFVCGEDVDMGKTPATPSGLVLTSMSLGVLITWPPAIGAITYKVWAKLAGVEEDLTLLGENLTTGYFMHSSGDAEERNYFIKSVSPGGESPFAAINGAGY